MARRVLSVLDHPPVRTPNLDALAADLKAKDYP